MIKGTIKEHLTNLRGKKTIREASKGMGISHSYLTNLERGIDPRNNEKIQPTFEVLKKISTYYNTSYIDLLILYGYLTNEDIKEYINSKLP